jgi:hypothetical protein
MAINMIFSIKQQHADTGVQLVAEQCQSVSISASSSVGLILVFYAAYLMLQAQPLRAMAKDTPMRICSGVQGGAPSFCGDL